MDYDCYYLVDILVAFLIVTLIDIYRSLWAFDCAWCLNPIRVNQRSCDRYD